ncbi:DinB family protein [Terriglobus albidus]|uniref:DinB family protein n=1 Tax=Terriglobus albidus TaxID=1592106 RepID=A0A5B9E3N5_9BACT|nr:DinB family protein [Terriglobus albidus]QEE26568.1 DinB family protein [Terriglobus albidus]
MDLYGPKQLAESIRTVRRDTVLIAEDIHEDDYLFRPGAGSRSVAETLIHIAFFSNFDYFFHEEEHVTTLEAFDFGRFLRDSEYQEKRHHHTKSRLIELLKDSGESWAEWVEFLPVPFLAERVTQGDGTWKTRFEMILDTKEHEMHHLGQLTVVERMLGIIPTSHEPSATRRFL